MVLVRDTTKTKKIAECRVPRRRNVWKIQCTVEEQLSFQIHARSRMMSVSE